MHVVVRTQRRRVAIIVAVPLAAFTAAYLLFASFANHPDYVDVLPALLLLEAVAVGIPATAILALVHRPALFASAAVALTSSAVFGVWAAFFLDIQDGQGGLALLTPTYVGIVAALVFGGVDELLTLFENKPD
ncbi:MAG: hypothetical protein QOJ52_833 [Acidimicrobiaceae bacterium]|nr:hypothetical protein [Acidimicrobiaceae bacterium]